MVANRDGLVLCWRFNEGYGAVARDTSGKNHVGTITGPTWTTGKYGNALLFDGVNDYVSASAASDLESFTAFTIAFWVKSIAGLGEGEADNYFFYVGKTNDWEEWFIGWQGWTDGLALTFDDETGTRQGTITSNTYLTADTWYHVVGLYDGTYLKIYLNGVLIGSTNIGAHTVLDQNKGVKISSANISKSFAMDEVHVFNRALSNAEIIALMYETSDPKWLIEYTQKNRSQLSKINNRQKQIELLKIINMYLGFKKEKVAYYE